MMHDLAWYEEPRQESIDCSDLTLQNQDMTGNDEDDSTFSITDASDPTVVTDGPGRMLISLPICINHSSATLRRRMDSDVRSLLGPLCV